jgi:guanine nucleotide-binding protein G(i) subunit alpha
MNVHGRSFENDSYRETFNQIILGNLFDGVLEVLSSREDCEEDLALFKDVARSNGKVLDADIAEKLRVRIWDDAKFFEEAMDKSGKIQLQDCFEVFARELKNYPEWGGPGWIASADDCIRARVRTSGVVSEEVVIEGLSFVFYDVGGQRAERRKWMHSFDSCTAALFVCAISEYDQVLFEDRGKNRLEEAFDLFRECVNSPWLAGTTTILFLNKKDLFDKKFMHDKIPLNVSGKFPKAPTSLECPNLILIPSLVHRLREKFQRL